jgi:hypothetical protein
MNAHSQGSLSMSYNLNSGPYEYEAGVLTSELCAIKNIKKINEKNCYSIYTLDISQSIF